MEKKFIGLKTKNTGERIPNWKKTNVKVVRNGSSSVFVD